MLLRVLVISRPASPSPRVSSLYTELFLFSLPPKTSLPHESRTCRLYLRVCTRNIKSPRVYTFTFVRVRHAFFRVPFLSVPSFLFFFFSLLLSTPSVHRFTSRAFNRQPSYFPPSILVISSLRPSTLFSGTELCPYHILYHIVICVHTEHRKIPIAIYVTRHRYIYTDAVSIFIRKSIERISISRSNGKLCLQYNVYNREDIP